MEAFEYARPKSAQEAIKLLAGAEGEALALAGGTDLISLMKDGVATPKRLVSLQHVSELKGISFRSESGLRLGAGVTLEELMENAEVREHYPALVQAAEGVSSPQVRSTGTVGGDLCQRPRCWYYRAGYGLLAVYKGKPLVPDGDNRYHAILGNSGPAYFVSPSSLAPILIALDAKVKLHGPQGARELSVQEFFVTPKSDERAEHALRPGEIVTEILVPHPGDVKMAVYEVRAEGSSGLATRRGGGSPEARWRQRAERPRGAGTRRARALAFAGSGRSAEGQIGEMKMRLGKRAKLRSARRRRFPGTLTKFNWPAWP